MLRYKKSLASVFFIFVLLMIFTFINQDDELHPDIPAFLELSSPVPANDGHAVLYALDAPLGSDVIAMGYQAIQGFQLNKDLDSFEFDNSLSSKIKTPCLDDIALCFESFKNGSLHDSSMSELDLEIQRRINIMRITPPLGNVFEPDVSEPYPHQRFRFLVQNNEFKQLIAVFLNGDSQTPLEYLYKDTQQLRDINKHSTDLLSKMINHRIIENNLQLIQLFSIDNNFARTMDEMIFSEISMEMGFSREYRAYYNLTTDLENNESEIGLIFEEKNIIDSMLSGVFFKNNKTKNKYFNNIQLQYLNDPSDFDDFIKQDLQSLVNDKLTITNFIGDLLTKVGTPNYKEYQLTLSSLSCKITQYNKSIEPTHQAEALLSDNQCNSVANLLDKDSDNGFK